MKKTLYTYRIFETLQCSEHCYESNMVYKSKESAFLAGMKLIASWAYDDFTNYERIQVIEYSHMVNGTPKGFIVMELECDTMRVYGEE